MPSLDDYSLLQPHTVKVYGLEAQSGEIESVPARSLLTPARFDLFAKLFYIGHRDTEPELAKRVYIEHIKAFNPDWKEPGREDKDSQEAFLTAFDSMIVFFRDHDFDRSVSMVPVGKDNTILDGSHRVAALVYFNRDVVICRFKDVTSNGPFNYKYFINRGMSHSIADIAASEALQWLPNMRVACLWPRIGGTHAKDVAILAIRSVFPILYERSFTVSRTALKRLVIRLYNSQDWIGTEENDFAGASDKAFRCYARNRKVSFLFFRGEDQAVVTRLKSEIRGLFPFGKHSLHITDTPSEVFEIVRLALTDEGRDSWLYGSKTQSRLGRIADKAKDDITYIREFIIPELKGKVVRLLTHCG